MPGPSGSAWGLRGNSELGVSRSDAWIPPSSFRHASGKNRCPLEGRNETRRTGCIASPHFPGINALGHSFKLLEEWYALKNFANDLHVILVQETAGMKGMCYQRPPYPSTWARRHGKGRVFFTSMAHRENVWLEEPFQQIVLGGLAWALGNVDVDVTPNVDEVTPRASVLNG